MKLYVVGSSPRGPLKLGRAGDPYKRLAELQVGNPLELKVLAIGNVSPFIRWSSREAEALCHKALKPRHIRGEWFDVTLEEVLALFPRGASARYIKWEPKVPVKTPLETTT